jgi:hypothetical protein
MSKNKNSINTETIVDSDTDDTFDVKTLEKQKRSKTDAQVKAFEKARLVRAENILKRQEEKQKEKEDFDKLKEMKKKIKELKLKKTREKELKELDDDNDDNHSISSEEEIVVKKVVKKKVPKKKKVIYIDENEDDESANDRNVIIVNKMPAPTINQHPPAPKPRPKAIFL